jgi:hypothetical protein
MHTPFNEYLNVKMSARTFERGRGLIGAYR